MNKFATRIKELRDEKNLTKTQLANAVKLSDNIVGRWESGERMPSLETLILLAKFFNVSTDYLLGLKDY